METVIAIAITLSLFLWFGRRLIPAMIAILFVLAVPIWLVGGFILDQVNRFRRPTPKN
jgi:hypothetical protein